MPKGGRPPRRGWEDKFFEWWKKTGLVHEACKVAGISKAYVYAHRKKDPEFAQRWIEEEERVTEILEQIALKRAAEGSDTLTIFLLKARRPGVYRENVHHQHTHQVSGQVNIALLDGHDPIEFAAAKRREAAKALLAGEEVIETTATPVLPVGQEAA